MGARLGLRVDARMLVEQQPIDGRRDRACRRVATDVTVVRRGPYRHATAETPPAIEKIRQPRASARAALVRRQDRIGGRERPLPFLQSEKFLAGRKDVAREQAHILEGPVQKRRDHRLRHARSPILLGGVTIARDLRRRPSRPRLERQRGDGKVRTIGMEVENDIEKLRGHDRAATPVAQKLGVAIKETLIHTIEIAAAEFGVDELEEAPCAVEGLTHAGRRQPRSKPGDLDVQPCVEILSQALRHRLIRNLAEMHGDVASAGILAKDGRPEIPTGVAKPRKIMTIEAGSQRRRRQHREIVQGRGDRTRGGDQLHCRISGGR